MDRFWLITYHVAETKQTHAATGKMQVLADSSEQALVNAKNIHARKAIPGTPNFGWNGPGGYGTRRLHRSMKSLTKVERNAITYDQPILKG